MWEQYRSKIEGLDFFATNFSSTPSGMSFIKEKIAQLKEDFKIDLKFEHMLVAMSPNGGLVALCKKRNYFDEKKSVINTHLVVMHQNADTKYYIPLNWDYMKRYIVSIDFSPKEQLYAFCNDGAILKIDILTKKAVEKVNSAKFSDERICKAKLFENGFIALTEEGSIYLVKDIKNPYPIFMVSVKNQLKFTNDIDFLGIPSNKSKSGKFELLLINQNGNGILHIEQQDTGENMGGGEPKSDLDTKSKIVPVSIILNEKLEKEEYGKPKPVPVPEEGQVEGENVIVTNDTPPSYEGWKINAMTMSPSGKQIALYSAEKSTAYIFNSNFNGRAEKLKIEINSDNLEGDDIKEIQAVLAFHQKYQFLFCSEDACAIAGQRFIILVNKKKESLAFQVVEGSQIQALSGSSLFTCFQEVDGIRYITKHSVYLLAKVSKDLFDTCDPFGDCPAKKLIQAYGYYLSKNAECDKIIRDIGVELPDAIKTLQMAAANIYWTDNNTETKMNKELQLFLIKAAQYGKSFVQKGDFNYDEFIQNCRKIRVTNYLRNSPNLPRFLTFEEYLSMDPDFPSDLIRKIIRTLNFDSAFDISNYLGSDVEKVYLRYTSARIKILSDMATEHDIDHLYEALMDRLKNCPNISFITIAKKCIKYHKNTLAEKFLENEKSIVVKVPQYLQLKNWDKALELSLESYDRTVIKVVLDKIFKVEEPYTFIKIVGKYPKAHTAVIEYLRIHDKDAELREYLGSQKDSEALLFISLENFFKCKTIADRRLYIKEAKEYLSGLSGNPNKDFYESYINDITHSLEFKKSCMEMDPEPNKNIIPPNMVSPFDNSIYDIYKIGIQKNYEFIEKKNKQFKIGQRKLSLLRFKHLTSVRSVSKIDEVVKKVGFKKLEISPLELAKMLYENRLYNDAVNYIKQITEPNDFDEKVRLLKEMNKLEDLLEVVISDKKCDKVKEIVNDVLAKDPTLKSKVNEKCMKYNVKI